MQRFDDDEDEYDAGKAWGIDEAYWQEFVFQTCVPWSPFNRDACPCTSKDKDVNASLPISETSEDGLLIHDRRQYLYLYLDRERDTCFIIYIYRERDRERERYIYI